MPKADDDDDEDDDDDGFSVIYLNPHTLQTYNTLAESIKDPNAIKYKFISRSNCSPIYYTNNDTVFTIKSSSEYPKHQNLNIFNQSATGTKYLKYLTLGDMYYAMVQLQSRDSKSHRTIIFYRDTCLAKIVQYQDAAIDVVLGDSYPFILSGDPKKITTFHASKQLKVFISNRLINGWDKKYLTRPIIIENKQYNLPVFGVKVASANVFGANPTGFVANPNTFKHNLITHNSHQIKYKTYVKGLTEGSTELGIFDNLMEAAELYDTAVIVMNNANTKSIDNLALKKLLNYPEKMITGVYKGSNGYNVRKVRKILGMTRSSSSSSSSYPKKLASINTTGVYKNETLLLPKTNRKAELEAKREIGEEFQANISIDGNNTQIGIYKTAREAALAYDQEVLFNDSCNSSELNFPHCTDRLMCPNKTDKITKTTKRLKKLRF